MFLLWFLLCTTPQFELPTVEKQFEAHIRFLAHDTLAGRYTGERGQRISAQYLAAQLRLLGLQGAFPEQEDPFIQPIELHTVDLVKDRSMIESKRRGKVSTLKPYQHFWPLPMGIGSFMAQGDLVFAGFGFKDDTYSDLDGIEIEDKWVVLMREVPEIEAGPLKKIAEGEPVDLRMRVMMLMTMGAKGIIILSPEETGAPALGAAQRMTLTPEATDAPTRRIILVPKHSWSRLFGRDFEKFEKAMAKIQKNGEPASFESDQELTVTFNAKTMPVQTENVAGVIPGTDPELKAQTIVVSAHYDHIGEAGAGVYNGADDNGSGSAMLLLLAETLRNTKPKRSIMFLWVTGEENGLLGSKYFVENPPIAKSDIIANLNMDMLGRNDSYTIGMIPAKVEGISTLQKDFKAVNSELPKAFTIMEDMDQYNTRSDHYSFLKAEIPALFLFSGVHEDYHDVNDDWEKLDYGKLARLHGVLNGFLTRVANAKEAPKFVDP